MTADLAELRRLLEALPVLHVVQGVDHGDGPPNAPHEWPGTTYETPKRCSVSPSPDVHGWTTDGGYDGYGLPESVATAIVAAVNALPELLDAAAERDRLRATNRELNRRCQRYERGLAEKLEQAERGAVVRTGACQCGGGDAGGGSGAAAGSTAAVCSGRRIL